MFAVGLLCIGSVVTFLVGDALRSGSGDAAVVVRLGGAEQREGRRFVPVTLVNSGGKAAETVRVEVVLERSGNEVERAVLFVDLLPRHASREGWVAFESIAAPGDRFRAGGVAYAQP